MASIDIEEIDAQTYRVTVSAGSTTAHEVTVRPEYAQKLCGGSMTTLELIRKSFAFLLERESNNSILRKFDLSVINHYFPEYERIISK